MVVREKGVGLRRFGPAVAVLLVVSACSANGPVELEASDAPSAEPSAAATSRTPAPEASASAGSPQVPTEPAPPPTPWSLEVASEFEWSEARGLLRDGTGYLAITVDQWPEEEYGGHDLRIRRVTAEGRLDRSYGDAGAVHVDRNAGDGWVSIVNYVRDPTDGSVVLFTHITDSDEITNVRAERVTADGRLDEDYQRTQRGLSIDRGGYGSSGGFAMTLLPDGAVRACLEAEIPSDGPDLFGLDPRGNRDARVGPDGLRHNILPPGSRCGDMLLAADGNLVLAVKTADQAELVKLRPNGDRITAFGGALSRRDLIPSQVRETMDGSFLVCGSAGDDVGVAQADPDGSWSPAFGERGLVLVERTSFCSTLEPAGGHVIVGADRLQYLSDGSETGQQGSSIHVLRLSDGSVDPRFADEGQLRLTRRYLARVLLDQHRQLVVFSETWGPRRAFLERKAQRLP